MVFKFHLNRRCSEEEQETAAAASKTQSKAGQGRLQGRHEDRLQEAVPLQGATVIEVRERLRLIRVISIVILILSLVAEWAEG